jgi:hypothetical protein
MTTTADTNYIRDLEATVDEMAAWLGTVPDATARWRPKPGAWSPIEIIGHLIDSAANNHTRFVRAAGQDDLVFPGYAQDDWVHLQNYAAAPWNEVITLWHTYNRHIARVMAAIPAAFAIESMIGTTSIDSRGNPTRRTSPRRWTT